MRQILSLCLAGVLSIGSVLPMRAQETSADVPHRKIYGFFLSNLDWGTGIYGIGSLYADNLMQSDLLSAFNGEEALYAGAAVGDIYYGCSYVFQIQGPPAPGDFISIDLRTGERTVIGKWEEDELSAFRFQDMTYSYADSCMYALGYEMGQSSVFTLDLATGKRTKVCDLDATAGSLAADYDGTLYAICNDGALYRVDKADGSLEQVLETGYGNPSYNYGLEFDHTDGSLYWTCNSYDRDMAMNFYLMRCDMKADSLYFEDLGRIGATEGGVNMSDLYIPFVLAGEDAPAAVSDLQVEPDAQGALKATLRWKAPSLTFGADNLSALDSVVVMRDGRILAVFTEVEPGQEMEYVDESVAESRLYEYAIYAVNAIGKGEEARRELWVGMDYPSAVGGLQAFSMEGFHDVRLCWQAPESGAHGSYLDMESIRYRVVRMPDSVVVVEDLQDTVFVDQSIEELRFYYYQVYAGNNLGATAANSQALVAGPALSLPFKEDFADYDTYISRWTVGDGNADAYQWVFSTGAGLYTFGDPTPAAEYYINPTFTPPYITSDADEWLMGPPVEMESGKSYILKFDYRCISSEKVELYLGRANDLTMQDMVKTIPLDPVDITASSFTEYVTKLPKLSSDGIRQVSFRLVSDFPENKMSFIQITNVRIEEIVANEELGRMDDVKVKLHHGMLCIEGDFDMADVYSADGRHWLSLQGNSIGTDRFASGLYLVRVQRDGLQKTFKVAIP